jgi:hypothetical protein
MSQEPIHGGGIGVVGMTFIVFLTLKLIGIIQWSWLWVLAPIWIPVAVFLFVAVIAFIIG